MADDPSLSSSLIAGRYEVDPKQVILEAGAGLQAYVARDRLAADGKRVAIAVSRDASPRARPLKLLTEPIDNLMVALAHGVAPAPGGKAKGYYVICPTPPGPPVSAPLNAWPEKALVDLVLRPVARVLDYLHARKITHRAIRPNNVFQSAPGQPVTLGAAWAAPPAQHQPSVFEPPYSAMCHPSARGDGTVADDVYALGVLLLTLFAGRLPMAGMDDASIIRWKLDLGSFGALTRDISVSGSFGELLRGMLAEDAEHRPLPAQLLDLANLRGRRVAARPARRSQQALMLNDMAVLDARMLAFALLNDPRKAVQFLRNGLITQWLRRALGDAGLAAQVEELVRGRQVDSGPRADPLLVMRAIAALNPRMPLCWRGIAVWPDGLPGLLADGVAGNAELQLCVEELLVNDVAAQWPQPEARQARSSAPDISLHRAHAAGPVGMLRLFYVLNPLLPCRASGMGSEWVATIADLLRVLEQGAAKAGDTLIDPHLAAFIAARADRRVELQVNGLFGTSDPQAFRRRQIAMLQDLQSRYHSVPLPGLAAWAADRLRPDLDRWRNKARRAAIKAKLDALAKQGFLIQLIELTDDSAARAADASEALRVEAELAAIDSEVLAIDHNDRVRQADAERFGQAITGGLGLSALILVTLSVLLR